METFKSGGSIVATFTFRDHEGNLVTPDSIEYIVTDKDSSTELFRDTDVPTGSSHVVVLSGDAVEMVDTNNDCETRLLSWYFEYTATINGQQVNCIGSNEECYKVQKVIADITPSA